MFNQKVMLLCMATALGVASAGCEITTCDEGAICVENDDSAAYQCSVLCRRLADCGRIDDGQRGACVDACEEGFDHDSEQVGDYCECVDDTSCRNLDRACGRPPISLPRPGDEDDAPGQPAVDAGSSYDASVDAAASYDAGTSVDAGSSQDAGVDADAALDASIDASVDAGRPRDAGTDARVDGGHDAGADASADSGSQPDAAPGSCSCDDDCAASEGCLNGSCHARCQASCECRLGDVCEQGLCVTPPPASISCENECDCPAGDKCVNNMCTTPAPAPLQ